MPFERCFNSANWNKLEINFWRLYMILPSLRGFSPFLTMIFSISWNQLKSVFETHYLPVETMCTSSQFRIRFLNNHSRLYMETIWFYSRYVDSAILNDVQMPFERCFFSTNWNKLEINFCRLYMILPSLRGFIPILNVGFSPSIKINWNQFFCGAPSAPRDATMWRLYSILNPWRKPFPPCEISRRIYEPSMKELWADYVRCPTPIFRHTLQCDNWLERIVKSRFVNDVNDNIFSLVFTRFYRNWISVLLL